MTLCLLTLCLLTLSLDTHTHTLSLYIYLHNSSSHRMRSESLLALVSIDSSHWNPEWLSSHCCQMFAASHRLDSLDYQRTNQILDGPYSRNPLTHLPFVFHLGLQRRPSGPRILQDAELSLSHTHTHQSATHATPPSIVIESSPRNHHLVIITS